jgi:serine/threonine-protein kinase 24/25/MST4
MSNCQCTQLTQYYTSFLSGSQLWIVMEYLEGGSLSDLLAHSGPLDEPTIAYVMRELLTALAYLHGERKIHRDVKAGNVLVSASGAVKLADFGVTGQLTESVGKRKTRVGTPVCV